MKRSTIGVVLAGVCAAAVVGLLFSAVSAAAGPRGKTAVGSGRHVVRGTPGNDVLHGGPGNEVIYGGRGNDVIYGGRGNDVIYGGPGDDRIIDKRGPATVFPGSGTNWVDVADGRGDDRVVCAAGSINHITADRTDFIAPSCLGKGSTVNYGVSVYPETWMGALYPQLQDRRLREIVIPGSHDATTYSLGGQTLAPYAITQSESLARQLNDGARQFDIRVVWHNGDYYARHGVVISDSLDLGGILDEIRSFTVIPGHEHEIVMLSLGIDTDNGAGAFPTDTCKTFDKALGSALLTPSELEAAIGTRDPGQVTPRELWSMPGHPRVIMDNSQCIDAGNPSAGQWSTDPYNPDQGERADLFGGYYANQCYYGPYDNGTEPGVWAMVSQAVKSRALGIETSGRFGSLGSDPIKIGPRKYGGFYLLNIQGTPTPDCGIPLRWFDLDADRQVLASLYQQWQTDRDTQDNLNIISGDYVQETDLVKDVIAMNETLPAVADQVTRLGPERVVVEPGQNLPDSFEASVAHEGEPVPYREVTYRVSPADGRNGPNWGPGPDPNSHTEIADENGLVKAVGLLVGPKVGKWTLTAGVGGASAKWTLEVVPSTKNRLQAGAGNPTAVAVGGTISSGFAVQAVNFDGGGVPGVSVTFDAASAGGSFPGGAKAATATTGTDGVARSPAFTAGTRAGPMSIAVSAPGAVSASLPLTVIPGPPYHFVATSGNDQTVPINTEFPVTLKGHYTDYYGNVVTDLSDQGLAEVGFPSEHGWKPPYLATWPNGTNITDASVAPDGSLTAPDL